jgi:ferredoxin
LRAIAEFHIPTAAAHSSFRMVVAPEICIGCGECVDRCPFGALSVPDDIAIIEKSRCMGCGQCVFACTVDALYLERRPADEITPLPDNLLDWMAKRSENRGLTFPA